jgi:methionine-rich copper-binding protein CopC
MSIMKTHHIENLFDTVNNTTDGITFTMAKEQDRQIPFLDILLTRTDNGSIETHIYRKKTHTDHILNYNSNHPTQQNFSCLRTPFNHVVQQKARKMNSTLSTKPSRRTTTQNISLTPSSNENNSIKQTNKLKSMFTKHEDQLDNLDKHNIVYKIPCQDCHKVCIGKTSKTVESRTTEHMFCRQ